MIYNTELTRIARGELRYGSHDCADLPDVIRPRVFALAAFPEAMDAAAAAASLECVVVKNNQ